MEFVKCAQCNSDEGLIGIDLCRSCMEKEDKKQFVVNIILGVIAVIVVSLLIATVVEFESSIDSFLSAIELKTTEWFDTLPSFLQTFLQTLLIIVLILMVIGLSLFVLVL